MKPTKELFLFPFTGFFQKLVDLSIEALMDIKSKVAVEVLKSVPGITFGHDVLRNISIIMRGTWAQEGQILLMIDGTEINERSYGTIKPSHTLRWK